MVDAFLGLVTFGGSIFSGFIRSQKLLTLLSGGRYYENFTVIRNDSWFDPKCSHPYIKGELFKTKTRLQRTTTPKLGWSIPQTETGLIELKHWRNVEIYIVTYCSQFDQNRPISEPTYHTFSGRSSQLYFHLVSQEFQKWLVFVFNETFLVFWIFR